MNTLSERGVPFFFLIDYSKTRTYVSPLTELSPQIFYSVKDREGNHYNNSIGKNGMTENLIVNAEMLSNPKYPPYESYLKSFELVQKELYEGNSYLVNLTFPTQIELSLSLSEIFSITTAPYRLSFQDEFVCFSPEPFVIIEGAQISTYPMKGTIDANIPNAKNILLNDPKEIAEHNTIVDLLRNDLGMVSNNIEVKKFRYIEEVGSSGKRLYQTSSEISGTLESPYKNRFGDIFSQLLPAGSICGAPKKKTLEIISKAEPYPRNYYTGVFGIYTGEKLISSVLIRFIEKIENQYFYHSGGGITVYSDPQKEYLELKEKIYVPIH